MNRLKILTINVRGLGSAGKSSKIVQELTYLNCDVVLLQESHVSCKRQAEKFEKLWKGKCFWSFGTSKSAGVAVIFAPNFAGNFICFLFDSNGRILSLLIDFHNLYFNVVNIYSPNAASERKIFFSDLHNYFLSQGLLLIGGDFNGVHNVFDKLNCSTVPPANKTSLVTLMSDFSRVDIWRKQNPHMISFAWSNSDRTQASGLDRFFIVKSSFNKVSSCQILPCVLSVHDFVKLELSLEGIVKRGASVWRFNNSLLSNADFKTALKCVIVDFKLKVQDFVSLRD